MRIAALYDLHGNVAALDAVLVEARAAGVDRVVIGGDVFPGPFAREMLAELIGLDLPVSFIRGNGESDVLQARAGGTLERVPEAWRETIRWNAASLDAAAVAAIASWPATLRMNVAGIGAVLFCHATPRDDNELITRATPTQVLRPLFEATGAALVVCGHTHMVFDRQVGSVRVVNAGSLGMPFGRRGADWLLLGPEVELRHTDYDVFDAAAAMRRSDYPTAEFFAGAILEPADPDVMVAAYERAAGRNAV